MILTGGHAKACAEVSWRPRYAAALLCVAFILVSLGQARAETLEQALADAYLINPGLNAERARLRATDEQVAIAKAGLRPNIGWSGVTDYTNQNSSPDFRKVRGPRGNTTDDTFKRLHDQYRGPNCGRWHEPIAQLYVQPDADAVPGV